MTRLTLIGLYFVVAVRLVGQNAESLRSPDAGVAIDSSVREINGICELSNGLVVVGFPHGTSIVDFAARSLTPIAVSVGSRVFCWRSDTTLVRAGDGAWFGLTLGGALRPWIPGDLQIVAHSGIKGTNKRGELVATRDIPGNDSLAVLLLQGTSGPIFIDRLAYQHVQVPPRPAYILAEEVGLAADGWLAFLRVNPYRVDWRAPDGHGIQGAPIQFDVLTETDRERKAYMLAQALQVGRSVGEPPTAFRDWPTTIPPAALPTKSIRIVMSPDGAVLILRTTTADHPNDRYDVIDRTGNLVRSIQLGAGERVIGSGSRGIYVMVNDHDGKRIERHPW